MGELNIDQALKEGSARSSTFDDLSYAHFIDDLKQVQRGTAVFEEGIVYGYPRIGRMLVLQSGLAAQFSAPFWMEEKIDGFNVRIVRTQGKMIALTRGGYICPFTTDRLPDLLDLSIFEQEPDLIVCGEVAGPDNPYLETSPPFIGEDVRLFVFDLMRLSQPGFLPQEEKIKLIEHYQLPSTEIFGRFTTEDLARIHDILLRLNDEWREGVVFKEDSPRNHRAKYVTSNSSISDIHAGGYSLVDLPPPYFTNRILRLALFLEEQGLGRPREVDRQMGAAFLQGVQEAIQQYQAEQKVYRTFRCRFRSRVNAKRMMKHLKRAAGHVHISQRDLRREGGYWLLEFDRIYPALTGLLSNLLRGGVVFD